MVTFFLILLCSFFLTAFLRFYALKRNVIDIPNGRSSHKTPTPRGGGMAFVIVFLMMAPVGLLIKLAAGLVVLIGFIDDHRSISAKLRFLIHCIAGSLVIYAIDSPLILNLFNFSISLSGIGYLFILLGMVWFINLYNFMDGIDGLAALEAISVAGSVLFLHYLFKSDIDSDVWLLYLITAICGFLIWNWPPAKIFMGDGGSGFLGFMMAYGLISDAVKDPQWLWIWLILLGCFVVDATFTLSRRFYLKIDISQPHRTHAYQYASRIFGHKSVSLIVFALNVIWLTPIALLTLKLQLNGMVAMFIAYIPLIILAIKFKAGIPECKS